MIIIPPIPRRKKRDRSPAQTAPPATLILTAAVYSETELTITLTFDRAIDVSAIVGSQIAVSDGVDNYKAYVATGSVDQTSPEAVKIGLVETGDYEGSILLNASNATGIVATDDGGTWAGAVDLALNYP